MFHISRAFTRRLARAPRSLLATPLVVALALWACVMLIAGAVLVPLAGWGLMAPVGLIVLTALLVVCWAVCVPFERAQREWRTTVNNASKETKS